MKITVEKNSNKLYYDLNIPVGVTIEGKIFSLKKWSMGGFILKDVSLPEVDESWAGIIILDLPFDGALLRTKVEGKVSWIDGRDYEFLFTKIDSRTNEIIKSYLSLSLTLEGDKKLGTP